MPTASVDAAAAPAAAPRFVAPSEWRAIDFISDLHLADDTPASFDAWAEHLRSTPADAVFILGDLFDAWPGDDARVEGFEARCAAVLKDAARQRFLAFMAGNRDFLVGPALLDECGVRGLGDPTVIEAFGQRVLLSHGDAWCLADGEYQRMRRQVRSAAWQQAVLSQSLAQRRALARQLRQQSESAATGRGSADWADVDAPLAVAWMRENATPVLVHGHTHRPATEQLAPGRVRHVLSDWALEPGIPPRAEILRWREDGFARVPPSRSSSLST